MVVKIISFIYAVIIVVTVMGFMVPFYTNTKRDK